VTRLLLTETIEKVGIFCRQGLTNGLIEVVHEIPRLRDSASLPPNCRLSASRAW
jgi:hypothetical protein